MSRCLTSQSADLIACTPYRVKDVSVTASEQPERYNVERQGRLGRFSTTLEIVIARSEATKQSSHGRAAVAAVDCFASLAMTWRLGLIGNRWA